MKHLNGHNRGLESFSDLYNYHHNPPPGFPVSSHVLLRRVKNKTQLDSFYIDIKKKRFSTTTHRLDLKDSVYLEKLKPSFSLCPPSLHYKKKKSDYRVRAILMILTDQLEKFR